MEDEIEYIYDDDDSMTAERNAWDRHSVLLLIKEYKKYRQEFTNPEVRKRIYWEKICNNLAVRGYNFEVEQCEKKWRNLKKTFKENEGKPVVTWVYFNPLKEIFSSEPDLSKRKKTVEGGNNMNSLFEAKMDVLDENSVELDLEEDDDSSPPPWFVSFLEQYRVDEKKKLKMLEDMHNDIVKLEKQKCSLLKSLIDKLP